MRIKEQETRLILQEHDDDDDDDDDVQGVLKLKNNSGAKRFNNLMHKILFYSKFISCPYMFRAHVPIITRSKLYYTASGIITPIGGLPVHRLRED